MVDAYIKNVNEAKRQHLQPAPTFHNLITLAEEVKQEREATIYYQSSRNSMFFSGSIISGSDELNNSRCSIC